MNNAAFRAAALVSLLLTTAPVTLAAKETPPLRLQPSSKWVLNYADDNCELSRAFGTDADRTTLHFIRTKPGDSFQLYLIGDHAKLRDAAGELTIGFGVEEPVTTAAKRGQGSDRQPAVIFPHAIEIAPLPETPDGEESWRNPEPPAIYTISPDREAAVREITFVKGLRDTLVLETGSLGSAFAALRECNEAMMTAWGIDIEAHRTLSGRVVPIDDPGDWLRSNDYPKAMLNRGQSGIVNFRLTVEADGSVSACKVQQSTRPKEFDDATCDMLSKRARFAPALDAAGQPIKSFWASTVYWKVGG